MSPETEGWAVAARVTQLEAEIVRAALETAEIPVQMFGEAVGQIIGLSSTDLGQVSVMVPGDRLDEAIALLQDSRPIDMPPGD